MVLNLRGGGRCVERLRNGCRDRSITGDRVVVGDRGVIEDGGFDVGLGFGLETPSEIPGERTFVL